MSRAMGDADRTRWLRTDVGRERARRCGHRPPPSRRGGPERLDPRRGRALTRGWARPAGGRPPVPMGRPGAHVPRSRAGGQNHTTILEPSIDQAIAPQIGGAVPRAWDAQRTFLATPSEDPRRDVRPRSRPHPGRAPPGPPVDAAPRPRHARGQRAPPHRRGPATRDRGRGRGDRGRRPGVAHRRARPSGRRTRGPRRRWPWSSRRPAPASPSRSPRARTGASTWPAAAPRTASTATSPARSAARPSPGSSPTSTRSSRPSPSWPARAR